MITVISLLLIACQTSKKKTLPDSAQKTIIGFEYNEKGERLAIVAGDPAVTDVWLEYIQAHNDKDLDKITSLDAEDIIVYRANGTIGKGRIAHREFLAKWFIESNPMWSVKWMVANTLVKNDGTLEHWLEAGTEFTNIVEGKKIFMYLIADVNIVSGKIKKINIYNREKKQ